MSALCSGKDDLWSLTLVVRDFVIGVEVCITLLCTGGWWRLRKINLHGYMRCC